MISAILLLPALFLLLFFCLQVVDITMKDGFKAGLSLTFTSIVIFPILCILEIFQSLPNQPENLESFVDAFVTSEKEMVVLDGIVFHKRTEQAENIFSYHIQCVLVNLDSRPDGFSGGPALPVPLFFFFLQTCIFQLSAELNLSQTTCPPHKLVIWREPMAQCSC